MITLILSFCLYLPQRVRNEETQLWHENEHKLLRSTYKERMQVSATKRKQLFQEKKWLQVTNLPSCLKEPVLCGKKLVSCRTELNKLIVIVTLFCAAIRALAVVQLII